MAHGVIDVNTITCTPAKGFGHCKLNEWGWAGDLGLSNRNQEKYKTAVSIRNSADLDAAAQYLKGEGWIITWAFVGVNED